MQFSIIGSPQHLGPLRRRRQPRRPHAPRTTPPTRSPPPPATCAPAAPRPTTARALFAYNHADWYVAEVLAKAAAYRGAARRPARSPQLDRERRRGARATRASSLTPLQRADLRAGAASTRACVATLAWIGRRHTVVITALRSDHSTYTVTARLQPQRRPRDGHRRRRRRDLPRHPHRPLRRPRARARRRRRARCARPSSSTAGTPTGPPTRAASRAPTTATTSTGAWTHEGVVVDRALAASITTPRFSGPKD